jgi:HlyD family secretion protein
MRGTGVKKKRKWIVITVVAVVVLLVLGGVIQKNRKGKENLETVRIETVSKGELTERVSALCEIEPKTYVQISARVSARIIDIPFDEGSIVTCGDPNANPPIPPSVILKLDAKDLESQLQLAQAGRNAQEAQIAVEKARIEGQKATIVGLAATLEQSRKDLERKQGLYESRDISKADFDQIKYRVDTLAADFDSAKFNLDAAQRNLTVLKHNLDAADARVAEAKEALTYTTITSPINGVVTRVNAKVGEMVMTGTMNNPGTVILEISDLDKMLAVAQVDEADVGALEKGQEAIVAVQAFGNTEFKGFVDEVALKHRFSDTGTRYYRTEILLNKDPNVSKLYTGLTGHVDIKTHRHADIMKVPSQAVLAREVEEMPVDIRDNSKEIDKNKTFATVVYRYKDGKAIATPVKMGKSDLTHTIILSGLNEGDKVIVGPFKVLEKLKHDQKVRDEREVEKEKVKSEKVKVKNKKDGNDVNGPAGK